jgi:hypothetical protein
VCAILLAQASRPLSPQTGAVEGDVTDSVTGEPIAGARVRLVTHNRVTVAKSGADGHFEFRDVPFGVYVVDADKPGCMRSSDSAGQHSADGVDLSASRPSANVHVALLRYAVITGKITDSAGVPLEGATVLVRPTLPGDPRQENVASATTNDLGEYRVAYLAPGQYAVSAKFNNPFGFQDAAERTTYYPHSLSRESAHPVAAATAQEVSNIDIQVIRQTGVRVSGRLIVPANAPPARSTLVNTDVALFEPDNSWQGASLPRTSARNNAFEFEDVLPGKYTLEAATYDDTDFGARRMLLDGRRTIEVADRDIKGLEIAMQASIDVPGTVTFEEGCTAVPVSIRLEAGVRSLVSFDRLPEVVADTGTFTLRGLTAGRFTPSIHPQASSRPGHTILHFVASATFAGRDVLRDGFELTGPDQGPLKITMACRTGTVGIQVLDANHRNYPGAMIRVTEGRTILLYGDREGARTISLAPGSYRIEACTRIPSDGDWSNPASCATPAEKVNVTRDAKVSLELILPVKAQEGVQ